MARVPEGSENATVSPDQTLGAFQDLHLQLLLRLLPYTNRLLLWEWGWDCVKEGGKKGREARSPGVGGVRETVASGESGLPWKEAEKT